MTASVVGLGGPNRHTVFSSTQALPKLLVLKICSDLLTRTPLLIETTAFEG